MLQLAYACVGRGGGVVCMSEKVVPETSRSIGTRGRGEVEAKLQLSTWLLEILF